MKTIRGCKLLKLFTVSQIYTYLYLPARAVGHLGNHTDALSCSWAMTKFIVFVLMSITPGRIARKIPVKHAVAQQEQKEM